MSDMARIYEVADPNETRELDILIRAVEETCKAYENDFSATKKRDWDAAKDGLKACIDKIEQNHFSADPAFNNIMAVVEFLQSEGYKIKKSKLYIDKDKGLLRVSPDGTVSHAEAMAYITRSGLEKLSDRASGLVDDMHAKKTRKEIERLEVQTEKARFDMDREKGKYLLKTDVRTEFALKLGAFESIFRNIIRTRAADYIGAVGGKPEKSQLLVDFIYSDLDEVINGVCNLEDIDIELDYRTMEESQC